MDWKSEYIDHKNQAEDFMRCALRAKGVLEPRVVPEDYGTYVTFNCYDSDHRMVLTFSFGFPGPGEAVFHNIKSYRSDLHGLSALALKTLLAFAHGRKCETLLLNDIENKGRACWQPYGSLPIDIEGLTPGDLTWLLEKNETRMTKDAAQAIRRIRGIAARSPLRGWRAMAQSDARFSDGVLARRVLFADMPDHMNHVIFLEEAQPILEACLGSLPQFHSFSGSEFPELARMLAEVKGAPRRIARRAVKSTPAPAPR